MKEIGRLRKTATNFTSNIIAYYLQVVYKITFGLMLLFLTNLKLFSTIHLQQLRQQ